MIPEPRLNNLYQEVILDHNRKPRNFKAIEGASHYSHGVNPLCGDDYHLYLQIQDGVIQDVGFQGNGCAISKSSASLLTSLVKGKTAEEASRLQENVLHLLTHENADEKCKKEAGRMIIFEGVREFPVRVKCATLIWHALQDALQSAPAQPRNSSKGDSHDRQA